MKTLVDRKEFVRRFMRAGLNYDQACCAYSALVSTLEDAVCNADKICFGNIGALSPVLRQPRDYVMGFERKPGKAPRGALTLTKRVFHVEERVGYRFGFFKTFARKHGLR